MEIKIKRCIFACIAAFSIVCTASCGVDSEEISEAPAVTLEPVETETDAKDTENNEETEPAENNEGTGDTGNYEETGDTENSAEPEDIGAEPEADEPAEPVQEKEENLFGEIAGNFKLSSSKYDWTSWLTLEADGTFTGGHENVRADNAGENYDCTVYTCEFSGVFADPVKVDDYTWSVNLVSLDYDRAIDTEYFVDRVRYIRSGAIGLDRCDKFFIYLPNLPEALYSDNYRSWKSLSEGSRYAIYNTEEGFTFFSDVVDY